jgi:hypothetical protein
MRLHTFSSFILLTVCAFTANSAAQTLVIDAVSSVPAPRPTPTQLGDNRAPGGATLSVNNQYLMRNGKPWIPVMGEFHYSRYPEAYWEEEILKMKADGVQIISTYVIWIHHEEIEGQFDWSGQRDLRKFAELCRKHGMLLYPRIGPWAHAEVRNGGLPDWVLAKGPVRSNNPVYLAEVQSFYQQIGAQLKGLLWKDGGPVIGVQIENEYALDGPGQGRDHLAALKRMAIDSGLDVPLYTVTGWDSAVVPADLFLPVYGGYTTAPWDGGKAALPPSEMYAFRFNSRVSGDPAFALALNSESAARAAALRAETPFFTAEVGGGIEDTYYRRPVLSAADIAATIPVMLGSGANLLGYYMVHGGENPDGKRSTLQESQRTNYPTDVPQKSYDFQAPLGEFGQMNADQKELKLFDYFLNDFGAELATARVIEPSPRPVSIADRTVLRSSARFDGQRGFLFVNNHVRGLAMPAWSAAQFEIHLPGKTVMVPASPIAVPADSYFIWPVNLDLGSIPLTYATAQPILKIHSGNDSYFFFSEVPGIAAEFAFPAQNKSQIHAESGAVSEQEGLLRVSYLPAGLRSAITIQCKQGITHLVLLNREDADNLWRVEIHGHEQLVISKAQIFSNDLQLTLRQIGSSDFDAAFFPAIHAAADKDALALPRSQADDLFQHLAWREAERSVSLKIDSIRPVGAAPAPLLNAAPVNGSAPVQAPDESSFAQAAAWRVTLPTGAMAGLSDLFLTVRYQGDEARLLDGDRLLTDNFFNGTEWRIGMKRFLGAEPSRAFTLQLLPLGKDAPVVFDENRKPVIGQDGQAGSLQSIEALPEYQLGLTL